MSAQAVVRAALKELAAARLRSGMPPSAWGPKTRGEEDALNRLCGLLLDVEGSLLAWWTDLPESEIQRLLPLFRDALGDFERRAANGHPGSTT